MLGVASVCGVVHVPLCTALDNVGSGKCLWCCTCSIVCSIRQRWEWQVFVLLYMFHCVQYLTMLGVVSVCGVVHVPLCAILDNVGMACSGGVVHVPLCAILDNVGCGEC